MQQGKIHMQLLRWQRAIGVRVVGFRQVWG